MRNERTTRRRRVLAAVLAVASAGGIALAAGVPLAERHAAPQAPDDAVHVTEESAAAVAAGRLLIVGASYSSGLGATEPSAGYPSLLAARMDSQYTVDAVSGTGFQNPGRRHQGTFAQRIAQLPSLPTPHLVIIQGGRDDTHYPSTKEYAAVLDAITQAQHRFPGTRVVVLGPIPASLPVSAKVAAIRTAIGRACTKAHAGFVDPIARHWITRANVRSFRGRIRAHPNDAGYAYIAVKLLGALTSAQHTARPPLEVASPPASATTPLAPRPPREVQRRHRHEQMGHAAGAVRTVDAGVKHLRGVPGGTAR